MTITSAPSPDGDGFVLQSEGLARHGFPELEMVGIPEAQAKNAAAVINCVADYVVNQRPVRSGERVAITSPHGALIARLVDGTPVPRAGLRGFFGSADRVQRIEEAVDSNAQPKVLLATMMLWRAHGLAEEGRDDAARAELRASIAFFPGSEGKRSGIRMPFAYNWENHLSYALLADLSEGAERARYFDEALARSEDFELERLGDSHEALQGLSVAAVVRRAEAIGAENAAETKTLAMGPGVTMVTSPIRRRAESEGGVVSEQVMTIVPDFMARYRSAEVGGVQELGALIVEIPRTSSAGALLSLLEDVRSIFESGNDDAPALRSADRAYECGDRIVSMLLADLRRRTFAGLSMRELRAEYGLSEDAPARQTALHKMTDLRLRESGAYMEAMGAPSLSVFGGA
ncbi:MAG: hypothetical protein AAF938_21800 [Myxococcota bacterium]